MTTLNKNKVKNSPEVSKEVKSFDLRKTAGIFNNLTILISKSFFRNPRGPIFMFVVPVLFALMFFFIMGNKFAGHSSLIAYTLIPALTILTSLAPAIVEWKNSVFLKRIDTTGIKKSMFLAALWGFYLVMGILSFFFMLLVVMGIGAIAEPALELPSTEGIIGADALAKASIFKILKEANWAMMLFSMILVTLTSIAIATFLGGLFNSEGAIQGIVFLIYFFSIFMAGVLLPPNMLVKSQGLMFVTYIIPFKFSIYLFLFATQGAIVANAVPGASGWDAPFNKHVEYTVGGNSESFNGMDFTATWQPVLVAILLIAALFVVTSFTFKWSAKK
ncbi:ABC transporter permease [[Acholeplasma] multilocale]|uniref:ABC transporter permease n=1 Tax=[Acholeplasma] multilocale TaxID=264638 RepID=UPI00047ED812|nr:ABC transporter permease [[Acholeplasma] multilocale]